MNDKEIREIRRRFRPNKSNITNIKGYVINREKQVAAIINQSLINTISDDCEKLLSVLKKVLSGTKGANLYDLEYTAQQVMESPEHKLLMDMRDSNLSNDDAVNYFISKVIENVFFDGEYIILLASDNYDVFSYDENGDKKEESDSVFSYIVCAVCPIKESKPSLYYSNFDNTFRTTDNHHLIANPEFGFMFPCFDDRATNIYKVQFYTKDVKSNHENFINSIFNVSCPKPAPEQKECFSNCLSETLQEDCSFELIKNIHDHVSEMVQIHSEANEDEPLTLTKSSFKTVLQESGIAEEKIEVFETKFEEEFGSNAEIIPSTIVDVKKLEVSTPYISIKVDPSRSDLISTEIINGSRYILIRANDNIEINGVTIDNN